MNGILMLVIAIVALGGAYLLYGRYLAKKWGIDPKRKTPAYEMEDGVDYVPTSTQIVFGHQFASIAGAGPINGPIQAAIFGWVPVLIWVLVGGIFIGAVQDFGSIYASVRNKGRSIGYVIELYVGKVGKRLFLLFVWLFSILVVAAFADIVAGTFNGFNADATHNIINGATATTSCAFILTAVGLGFFFRYAKAHNVVNTAVAVLALVGCIAFGIAFPMFVSKTAWLYLVFAYILIASVVPVWALLQPRDYLNSFLLVFMIIAAVVGIFVANPSISLPAFSGFNIDGQNMFPILFVTIACGAVSGFHSLVSSGTSSKQIQNEQSMLPVTYGAMLLESLVAVIALICAGAVASNGTLPAGTPPQIFSMAVAGFLEKVGIPSLTSNTIMTLAISAFALTSLDSVARIGRLSFQEIFLDSTTDEDNMSPLLKLLTNKYFATVITLFLGYLLSLNGYKKIWPLFGSANQLVSALALCAIAIFLKKTKKKGSMIWVPMFFMLAVTFTALAQIIVSRFGRLLSGNFVFLSDGMQLIFGLLLVGLGVVIAFKSIKTLFFSGKEEEEVAEAVA
jgi:carbon starvation protein